MLSIGLRCSDLQIYVLVLTDSMQKEICNDTHLKHSESLQQSLLTPF